MGAIGCKALLLASLLGGCDSPELRDAVEVRHGLQAGRSTAYVDLGPADPSVALRALIALPVRDAAALDATIDAIYDPTNQTFRKYLSVADWEARHAPELADVDVVTTWLEARGLSVSRVATNRLLLEVKGTAAAFNATFETELHRYGKQFEPDYWTFGTRTDLIAPKAIAERIASVVVADPDFVVEPLPGESGQIETAPPPSGNSLTLAALKQAYKVAPLHARGFVGQGTSIGVVVGASFKQKDVQSFWRSQGITRPDPKTIVTMEPPSTRFTETTLDIEWAGGIAPGAELLVYMGPDSHDTSLVYTFNEAIGEGRANVITDSFAHREDVTPVAIREAYHASAQMAAALGITVVAAAGDSGAPDVPSSSPLVTSVGGTVLERDANGARVVERAWSGSGAGDSSSFGAPWWQAPLSLGERRAVSDVALAATRYWVYVFGEWKSYSGTSFSAPAFAGIVAVINSERRSRGLAPIGFLNSTIYTNRAVQAAFHDVNEGGSSELPAAIGWDYPTGWGAPDAAALVEVLP